MIGPNSSTTVRALCFQAALWLLFVSAGTEIALAGNDSEALGRAEALLNKCWYMEALGRLQDIVEHERDSEVKARALLIIGQTYEAYLDQKEIALTYYENVLADFPQSAAAADALLSSGVIYFDQKDYSKAHGIFKRYMQAYPQSIRYKSAAAWADIAAPLMAAPAQEAIAVVPPPAAPVPETPLTMSTADAILRVLTHRNLNQIKIRSAQTITVTQEENRQRIHVGGGPLLFSIKARQVTVNGKIMNAAAFRLESTNSVLEVNGRAFRGAFVIAVENNGLTAVNHISTEQYLYGVMPAEMPADWPMEALMAQAVAARTYALYMRERNFEKTYDLEADTASQVYGGLAMENRRTSKAVDQTRGQVITHEGRLIAAYYHSNSGGHTEDPGDVWNARIPYLRGIPDQYSATALNGDWEYFLSYDEVARRLRQCGLRIGQVAQLKTQGKSRSGRNMKVLVVSDKGVRPFTGSQFRMTMGETKLKSTLFQMIPYRKGILLRGRGYGHGVGMSQWGAKHMAGLGSNYREILRYYYYGVQIVALRS